MQPWMVTVGANSFSRLIVAALRNFMVTCEVPKTGIECSLATAISSGPSVAPRETMMQGMSRSHMRRKRSIRICSGSLRR